MAKAAQMPSSKPDLSYDKSLFIKGMKNQVEFYNKWQIGYDQQVDQMGYGGPEELISMMDKHVSDKDSKVIDVVAGSGILGSTLRGHGYNNLEALDGSEQMLNIAKGRQIYREYHCELLEPNKPTTLPEASYDAAVASGCFAPGHLNSDHLLPILKLVRKGGKVFFAINDKWCKGSKYLTETFDWNYDMEGKMKELEDQGRWKQVEKVNKDGYFEGIPGRYYVFEVL